MALNEWVYDVLTLDSGLDDANVCSNEEDITSSDEEGEQNQLIQLDDEGWPIGLDGWEENDDAGEPEVYKNRHCHHHVRERRIQQYHQQLKNIPPGTRYSLQNQNVVPAFNLFAGLGPRPEPIPMDVNHDGEDGDDESDDEDEQPPDPLAMPVYAWDFNQI